MYIFAFQINNFRSFKNLWGFPNSSVNVIIGPNNCGKSTIIKALSYVLDPTINYKQQDLISRFDFFCADISQPVEINIWLKPDIQTDESGNYIFTDSERLKNVFFDKLSAWRIDIQERDITGEKEFHPVGLEALTIDPMQEKNELPEHERLLAIQLKSIWNNDIEASETDVNIIDEVGNNLAILNKNYKELIGFKAVGGRRNPVNELSLSRKSVLSKMINDDEVNIALRELLIMLDKGKDQLLEKPSIKNLMERLSNLVAPELIGSLINNLGAEFTLTFLGSDLWRLRSTTTVATKLSSDTENTFSLPLEYQGDGAQNLILISHLIKLLREPKDNDIILLEEPEQNLEPSLARWIFSEFCSLTQKNQSGQLFVTTHAPSLVSELKGADSLLVFSDDIIYPGSSHEENKQERKSWQIISARNLDPDSRKKIDQDRERYIPSLFSRLSLVVEGSSEIGFLPVAFNYFSNGKPGQNPYHLGLEIINGESRNQMIRHAKVLRAYGKHCHLLFDYDTDITEDMEKDRLTRYGGLVDFITCWPKNNLLSFTTGCDLEVILAYYVQPAILFEAIKNVYSDSGHPLEEEKWKKVCSLIKDSEIIAQFPNVYGDFDLQNFDLVNLDNENIQRAFLYVLLHGPHECKATKDMRMIAEHLADNNSIPNIFNDLREKVLQSIKRPEEINHNAPYLASR